MKRVLLILAAAFLLAGCFSPWDGDTATITINLGTGAGTSARASDYYSVHDELFPELEHRITLKGSTEIQVRTLSSGETSAFFSVAPGLYEITVEAWWGENMPYAKGSGIVDAKAGELNTLIIEMIRYDTIGTPDLDYELINEIGNDNNNTYRVRKGSVTGGAVVIPAYYRKDANSLYLPVTEIGNGAFSNTDITSISIPDSIESIGDYAFQYCSNLIEIKVPDSVTFIGDKSFEGCTNLESITLPFLEYTYNGLLINIFSFIFGYNPSSPPSSLAVTITGGDRIPEGGFAGYKYIKSIYITASSITSIDKYAFQGCTNLTEINISANVTSIGLGAFFGCTSLVSINIPDSLETIGEIAFVECTSLESITIPAGVTEIGKIAFSDWTPSQTIYIEGYVGPQSAISAGWDSGWFWGCNANIVYLGSGEPALYYEPIKDGAEYRVSVGDITGGEVEILAMYDSKPVTEIGSNAFNGKSITKVTIPSSVKTIGNSAFQNCASLQTVIFASGSQLESIGLQAFQNCTSLDSISIPNSVKTIGNLAFYGCTALDDVTLPSSDEFTTINQRTFGQCTSLTSIVIPDSVTTINAQAFAGCTSLQTVTFEMGSQPLTIGDNAFANCTFNSITIPARVSYIGEGAFDECTNLTSVTFATGSNILDAGFHPSAFPGDLKTTYLNVGKDDPKAGTFTRPSGSSSEWVRGITITVTITDLFDGDYVFSCAVSHTTISQSSMLLEGQIRFVVSCDGTYDKIELYEDGTLLEIGEEITISADNFYNVGIHSLTVVVTISPLMYSGSFTITVTND